MTTIEELRHEANALNVCGGIAKLMRQAASELEALQKERDALKVEYESRAIWIANMLKALDCENKDGFHCVDAHAVAETLRAQDRELRSALEQIRQEHLRCMQEVQEIGYSDFNYTAGMANLVNKLLSQPEAGKV